jgi:hypothetical protein
MKMPKVWEILESFKASCKSHGWKASDHEDWVEVDSKYHNFLSTREITLSSFKRIIMNGKCVIREAMSYRVVQTSYSAWLFSETPSEALTKTVCENPDFSSKIAVYDLSQMLDGKSLCTKLNQTDSPVFKEFENFLQNRFGVKFEPLMLLSGSEGNSDDCAVVAAS